MLSTLPRRDFLRLLGTGLTAAYIEQHIGLWERIRTYLVPMPRALPIGKGYKWNLGLHRELMVANPAQFEAYLRLTEGVPIKVSCKSFRIPMEYTKLATLIN